MPYQSMYGYNNELDQSSDRITMLKYISGDLFQTLKSPTKGPLVVGHACNCLGVWGGGVALAFKQKFPSSYTLYMKHCKKSTRKPENLLGTTLLIPISRNDRGYQELTGDQTVIACFFTSVQGLENPYSIVKYTGRAFEDMKRQLNNPDSIENEIVRRIVEDYTIEDISFNIPQINAGIFAVPWEDTAEELEKCELPVNVFIL